MTLNRRIPALDGLRGIAILLVVVHHAGINWTSPDPHITVLPFGGAFGVVLFFVLSGYLITTILLREVNLREFYTRRFLRLIPALVVFVAFTPIIYYLAGFTLPNYFERAALPVLAYAGSVMRASGLVIFPLDHTWSLAVEEHFYLVWPLAIGLFGLRRTRSAASLLGVALAWRVFLNVTGGFDRTYWSTDGNAFAILAGCVLAISIFDRDVRPPRWAATAGIMGVIAMSLVSAPHDGFILWGSIPVAALSVLAVWGCTEKVGWIENPTLIWFGTISYGLYLWHQTIYKLPILSDLPSTQRSLILTAFALALTWLSWTFVERPLMERSKRPRIRWEQRRSTVPPKSNR